MPTPAFPPLDRPPEPDAGSEGPVASAASESPDWVAMAVVHEDISVVVSSAADEVAVVDFVDADEVAGAVGYEVGSVAVPVGSQYCSQIFQ